MKKLERQIHSMHEYFEISFLLYLIKETNFYEVKLQIHYKISKFKTKRN